jgi:26S proteasome regulatory complex component
MWKRKGKWRRRGKRRRRRKGSREEEERGGEREKKKKEEEKEIKEKKGDEEEKKKGRKRSKEKRYEQQYQLVRVVHQEGKLKLQWRVQRLLWTFVSFYSLNLNIIQRFGAVDTSTTIGLRSLVHLTHPPRKVLKF